MIKIVLLISIILFQSCFDLYMIIHKNVMNFKINDSTLIILNYTGGGATASDYLQVIKKDLTHSNNVDIKILDGFDDHYLFQFQKINDSILNLKMTDTAYSKGHVLNIQININQIDTTLNQFKTK